MFVDSSFLADLGRGRDAAVEFYEDHAHAEFSATTIVAYELFGGLVEQGAADLVTDLQRDLDWVDFIPFSVDDAAETARLESELVARGERIRISDTMIAAVARKRGERLVAADEHFERVIDLDYIDFRAQEDGDR